MSDELLLNGKQYVSSKRAADETGYARDYIGQLSRGGLIDAERVGGLWYVSLDSLRGYEKNAEAARSFSVSATPKEPESSLTFEGKDYISASRASKLTGYNQDYVGQLARGGKIPSRQIGNRWYVDRDALVQHKAEKDALLAAVQSESVGLRAVPVQEPVSSVSREEHVLVLPTLTYRHESVDLMPRIATKSPGIDTSSYTKSTYSEIRPRTAPDPAPKVDQIVSEAPKPTAARRAPLQRSRKRSNKLWIGSSVGALTIILVLSLGIATLSGNEMVARLRTSTEVQRMTAGASAGIGSIGDIIENIVSPKIVYNRSN